MNTNEELIHRFIDGELSGAEEEQLFSSLAANPDLRAHLHEMQAIRTATRNYAATIVPPAALTQQTFELLGFSTSTGASVATTSTFFNSLLGFFKAQWLPLVSIVTVSGIITTIAVTSSNDTPTATESNAQRIVQQQQFESNESSEPSTSDAQQQTEISEPANESASHQESNVTTNAETRIAGIKSNEPAHSNHRQTDKSTTTVNEQARGLSDAENPIVHSNRDADRSTTIQAATSEDREATHPTFDVHEVDTRAMEPRVQSSNETGTRIPSVISSRDLWVGFLLPERFSIEYRASSLRTTPNSSVPSRSDPLFNNMYIGVHYSLTERHQIGLAIGQEAFPQRFNGKENSRAVRYEQNLLTQWFSASYRYRFGGIRSLGGIEPFATMHAGITAERWPFMKAEVGLMYSPMAPLTFVVGLDGRALYYPFQSTWFGTTKYGVTYGIILSF